MKSKVLAIITVLLLFASAFSASAATVTVSFDAGANGIDVSGTVPEATQGGDDLLLLVKNELGEGILAARTKSVYQASGVTYAFDKQLMSALLPSGTYTVSVSGRDFSAKAETSFSYTNPIMVYNALKDLSDNSAVGKTADELCAAFERDASALGLDTSNYSKLKPEGKAAFAAIMKTVNYSLPADYTYSSEIAAEIEKVKVTCQLAGAAGLMIDIENSAEAASWYATFYNALGFNDGTDTDAVTPLLITVKDSTSFVNRIAAMSGTPTIEEIKVYMYESALLAAIETETDAKVKAVYETFSSYFPELNLSAYNDLSDLKKGRVISAISGTAYEDCTAAAEAFNEAVSDVDSGSGSEGGSGSGSGRGSVGGGASGGSIYMSAETDNGETKAVFNDLAAFAWAEEAVTYLYNKGIISGRGNGAFAPRDNVTRAELVKMVMTAIGETGAASDAGFNDVSNSDWFAPYVASAKARGIVTGDENGNFNPNAPVSREDIATILYRTVDGGAAKAEPEFTDASAISGYAKAAVAYFAENGIINGLGDGSFGPRQNATRAQTAVILYRLMTITMK